LLSNFTGIYFIIECEIETSTEIQYRHHGMQGKYYDVIDSKWIILYWSTVCDLEIYRIFICIKFLLMQPELGKKESNVVSSLRSLDELNI